MTRETMTGRDGPEMFVFGGGDSQVFVCGSIYIYIFLLVMSICLFNNNNRSLFPYVSLIGLFNRSL